MSVSTRFADSPRNGAWGDRPYAIIDHAGPVLYAPIVPGVAPLLPTGGDPVAPAEFGLTAGLEGIFQVGGSISGKYVVYAYQLGAYNQGLGNPTWTLQWVIAATGVEAAAIDLSAEIVRLVGFGPY